MLRIKLARGRFLSRLLLVSICFGILRFCNRENRAHEVKHPLCHTTSDGSVKPRIWVLMHSWDEPTLLTRAIQSVRSQHSTNGTADQFVVNLVIFVDRCGSGVGSKNLELCEDWPNCKLLTPANMNVCPSLGSAAAKWAMLSHVRNHSSPTDYFTFLDGDDVYRSDTFLSFVVTTKIIPERPYFMWGVQSGRFSNQCKDLDYDTRSMLQQGVTPQRTVKWVFCHPRFFQAVLLSHLSETQFKRKNGTWLQKATDRPLIYAALETANRRPIIFLSDMQPHVLYSETAKNGLKRFDRTMREYDLARAMQPIEYDRPITTIHVVCAIFDRGNTDSFMRSFFVTELEEDQVLKVHIANNLPERQDSLMRLAKKFSNGVISFTITNMGMNLGGYGRFVLAKSLLSTEYIDYFIFLDDDQLVLPSTIGKMWSQRRRRALVSWFGKCWNSREKHYWSPTYGLDEVMKQAQTPKTWHYGGTGLSIVDSLIFTDERVSAIPPEYAFVEDLWLSYVIRLNNWSILRANASVHLLRELNDNGQYVHLKPTKAKMFWLLQRCDQPLPMDEPCE